MYTDEQISSFMNKVYDEISKKFEVFGVFLKGSQNYGLATDTSDVDLVVVVIPSFHDFACEEIEGYFLRGFEKKSERDWGTVEIMGIREFFRNFCRPNIANHEFLYTKYVVFNEAYVGYWLGGIQKNREVIIGADSRRLLQACIGCTYEALKQAFSENVVDENGYLPKRLVYAKCCIEYIRNHLARKYDNPFEFENLEELKSLKTDPVSFDRAKEITKSIEEELNYYKTLLQDLPVINAELDEDCKRRNEVLCLTLENILKTSFTHQLLPGGDSHD